MQILKTSLLCALISAVAFSQKPIHEDGAHQNYGNVDGQQFSYEYVEDPAKIDPYPNLDNNYQQNKEAPRVPSEAGRVDVLQDNGYRAYTVQPRAEGETHTYAEYKPRNNWNDYSGGNHYQHNSHHSGGNGDGFNMTHGMAFLAVISSISSIGLFFSWRSKSSELKSLQVQTKQISAETLHSDATKIFTCEKLTHEDNCFDNQFNVYSDQPWMRRNVECYQWQERQEQNGDMTKYHYTSVWSSSHIDSSNFKEKDYNNTRPSAANETFQTVVKCGAYKIIPSVLAKLLGTQKDTKRKEVKIQEIPGKDRIGDMKLTYEKIKHYSQGNVYSMVSNVNGEYMDPIMIMEGKHTLQSFFAKQVSDNDQKVNWALFAAILAAASIGFLCAAK